jgi:hypothetical protein
MQLLAYPRSVAGCRSVPPGNVRLAERWAAAVGSFVDRRAKAAERRPKDYVRLAGAHRRRHFQVMTEAESATSPDSASDGMQR